MINIEINSKDYDLSDEERSRAVERIGGLDEFMGDLDQGRVRFSWEGGPNEQTKVHASVWGGGNQFEASDTDWKAKKAIDQARQKLESQIRREHSKGLRSHDQHR